MRVAVSVVQCWTVVCQLLRINSRTAGTSGFCGRQLARPAATDMTISIFFMGICFPGLIGVGQRHRFQASREFFGVQFRCHADGACFARHEVEEVVGEVHRFSFDRQVNAPGEIIRSDGDVAQSGRSSSFHGRFFRHRPPVDPPRCPLPCGKPPKLWASLRKRQYV